MRITHILEIWPWLFKLCLVILQVEAFRFQDEWKPITNTHSPSIPYQYPVIRKTRQNDNWSKNTDVRWAPVYTVHHKPQQPYIWESHAYTRPSRQTNEAQPRRGARISAAWTAEPTNDTLIRVYTPGPIYQQGTPVPTESGRFIHPDSIQKFTETLGAINTVGRYLVNMTRAGLEDSEEDSQSEEKSSEVEEDIPGAIYTISKNVLGRNVTDTIVPIVRQFPLVNLQTGKVVVEENRPCTTPDGGQGQCEDLSSCPELLLDLGNLRQSICFKSLFVPGVCCPVKNEQTTTIRPTKPPIIYTSTTRRPTTRYPIQQVTTTRRPATTLPPLPPLMVDTRDCGQQEIAGFRVVGGETSPSGKWPWMAAIFLHGSKRTEFWCGGSLIGRRHILTAAHCTRDSRQRPFNARQFTVRLGDVDLRRDDEPSSPETYNVVEVKAHPKFSRVGFYNDIAVLVLDRDVRKTKYVIPLCLPYDYGQEKFISSRPVVVGWGTTYYGGKESSTQMQAELPVWRNEECDRAYFQPINENFICAGYKDGGKDACQGDSGGPLMLKKNERWMQIGIVSFGNKCGEPGYPGVYTRVTQYLDWIRQNVDS